MLRPVAALQNILLQCRRKVRMVSGIKTNLPLAIYLSLYQPITNYIHSNNVRFL